MDKCIEVYIPGFLDEGLYFEGVNGVNLLEIIDSIVKSPSLNNGENLERLNKILDLMDQINKTSDLLSGDKLDPAYIGDNVIGNASILELGKLLFRSNVENSTSLVPMFSLLASSGFKISSSNIILTSDPRLDSKIYLGNKYFKILANPTKPNFVSQLYKSLGFAYVNIKIQNNGAIKNILESYLDLIAQIPTGDENFDSKIAQIQTLSSNQKIRAFLSYILNESNVPSAVQEIVNNISIAIETDIEGHLLEHIKKIREQREYGRTNYQDESRIVNSSRAELDRQLKELNFLRQLKYYNTDYLNDVELINKSRYLRGDKKLVSNQVLEVVKKRRNAFEKFLEKNQELLETSMDVLEGRDIDKEYADQMSAIESLSEMNLRVSAFNRTNSFYNNNWNPYSLLSKNDFLEELSKKDLNLEVISPRTITFAGEIIETPKLREFLKGLSLKVNVVFDVPSLDLLIDLLNADGIDPLDGTIPVNRAQRKFLFENQDLFKLFWNPMNYNEGEITSDNFNIFSIINNLIQENTIYLPYEDYLSDYSFDLRGLSIETSEGSFRNGSVISRYRGSENFKKSIQDALEIKFTTAKNSKTKVKNNVLIIPIGTAIESLPSEVENYLQSKSVKKLYLSFESNNNIDPEAASRYFKDVVSLVNNTPGASLLNTFIVKGLNRIQIELSKIAADLGMSVRVFTDDQYRFDSEFLDYQTKSFTNDAYYKFPETDMLTSFNSNSLEDAFINKEISGLLYNTSINTMGDTIKMSKLMPGNIVHLEFSSGNKIQGLVKNVVKFNASRLFNDTSDSGAIEVGSKVRVIGQDKRGRNRWLTGDFYVVAINGDNYTISDGFRQPYEVNKSSIVFDQQSPIRDYEGTQVFPVASDPSKFIEVNTGNIVRINKQIFDSMYSEVFTEMSALSGLDENYLKRMINPENASKFGVVDIMMIEDMNVNPNPGKLITKSDTETILSTFADNLNTVFGGTFVNVMSPSMMQESELSSYEYQHPAFIKDGQIYLNLEHPAIHPGSLVHELSHLILGAIRVNNPDVYYGMLAKVDLESGKYDNLKVRYKNRLRSDIQEEVLADLFGKYFDRLILDYGSLKEAFDSLSLNDVFKLIFNISEEVSSITSNEELMTMTLNDAVMKTSSAYGTSENIFDNTAVYKMRLVSNLKEQLYKDGKLEETCH